jgi:hypothetical protein
LVCIYRYKLKSGSSWDKSKTFLGVNFNFKEYGQMQFFTKKYTDEDGARSKLPVSLGIMS